MKDPNTMAAIARNSARTNLNAINRQVRIDAIKEAAEYDAGRLADLLADLLKVNPADGAAVMHAQEMMRDTIARIHGNEMFRRTEYQNAGGAGAATRTQENGS
jgi:hypothetical protein